MNSQLSNLNDAIFFKLVSIEDAECLEALGYVIALQEKEGWEIRRTDLHSFLSSDQNKLFLILKNEKIIGCLSLFQSIESKFISIGSFIIDETTRGQGVGSEVLKQLLAAYPNYSAALLSAPGRENFYQRSGFNIISAFATFSITLPASTIQLLEVFKLNKLSSSDKEKIVAYDQKAVNLFRDNLLIALLDNATIAHAIFKKGQVVGYALARPFEEKINDAVAERGYRVSAYANDASIFEELFGKTVNHLASMGEKPIKIVLDCPKQNVPLFVSPSNNRVNAGLIQFYVRM